MVLVDWAVAVPDPVGRSDLMRPMGGFLGVARHGLHPEGEFGTLCAVNRFERVLVMIWTAYWPWALILVLGVAVSVVVHVVSGKLAKKSPFYRKKLLTGNELHFYKLLDAAVGSEHVVLCQVSMGALIDNDGAGTKRYWQLRGQYSQKIVDYAVCDLKTMEVRLLIELDDKTHSKLKDRERDGLTGAAGYKTLRFESKKKPSKEELTAILRPFLSQSA